MISAANDVAWKPHSKAMCSPQLAPMGRSVATSETMSYQVAPVSKGI